MNIFLKILIPIKISVVAVAFSCNSDCKVADENICMKYFNLANLNVNMYYKDSSIGHLDTALFYIDSEFLKCPEFKTRFTNLKISVLLLLKDDKKGRSFVKSLDRKDFDKMYKKDMFLETFNAIKYERNRDTTKRNQAYSKISSAIDKYLLKNPKDYEAYMDFFIINVKLKGKKVVINEIESVYRKRINDDSFLGAAIQTIESLPE